MTRLQYSWLQAESGVPRYEVWDQARSYNSLEADADYCWVLAGQYSNKRKAIKQARTYAMGAPVYVWDRLRAEVVWQNWEVPS